MPATSGKGFLLQLDADTTPVTLAAQRGGTINLEKDLIDVTSKSDAGYRNQISGIKDWSIDVENLIIQDDAQYAQLIAAFKNDTNLDVQFIRDSDTKVFRGVTQLTSFTHELPYDDAATFTGTLTGQGVPTKFWET